VLKAGASILIDPSLKWCFKNPYVFLPSPPRSVERINSCDPECDLNATAGSRSSDNIVTSSDGRLAEQGVTATTNNIPVPAGGVGRHCLCGAPGLLASPEPIFLVKIQLSLGQCER
jgi:hypothetical protein